MSKVNALAGLIGNYGDSDDDSDDGSSKMGIGAVRKADLGVQGYPSADVHSAPDSSAAIHPAPIPHCPWSACYDETSGFTYYWNQQTNAVTWEAPPEYLLALKLAQQQLHISGSTEVSAEEWQLYQLALAEKQNSQGKVIPKPTMVKPVKKPNSTEKNSMVAGKRRFSDEDEKIELITSYHNSDSESNDEAESPVKVPSAPKPPKLPKTQPKKPKTVKPKEFGPVLPPNQNYTLPIGPEIPAKFMVEPAKDVKETSAPPVPEELKKPKPPESEDSQDENVLLTQLKNKAKLLEKLGGEIPVELQKIIEDENNSTSSSPKISEVSKNSNSGANIDDLLQEIEKKELPKVAKKSKIDMFSEEARSNGSSLHNSPRSNGFASPSRDEVKPLFPSSKNIADVPTSSLFPSVANIQDVELEREIKENPIVTEKKGVNLYLADAGEGLEKAGRKKLRISNSVLPPKKSELPSYTTKYAQAVDGFAGERTGLGFSKEDDEESAPKNTISYGNGLMFTKGETLNEDKKDEDLDDMTELLELKLKYLTQLQPSVVSPVQEMMIQMQTLAGAFRGGGLSGAYWRRWARGAAAALRRHEAQAAPPGWTCVFQRSEGRYRYEREADGLVQWEYPAAANMDMDICTTPPHPGIEQKEVSPPPRAPAAAPPPPAARPRTPPPPAWADPPPPGCDDVAPPLPPEPKQEIGDELTSFYNDIAELEKAAPLASQAPAPAAPAPATSPEAPRTPDLPPLPRERERERAKSKEKEKEKEKDGKVKKKSKVKISSSMGMKHKSVSSLVAKWQQVADEIHSD